MDRARLRRARRSVRPRRAGRRVGSGGGRTLRSRRRGGESLDLLAARVGAACDEVADQAARSTIVVVTHVSPIKAALAWALGVAPVEIAWRMYVEDASVSRIDIGPDGPVVRWFNRGVPPVAEHAEEGVGASRPRRQRRSSLPGGRGQPARHASSVASRSRAPARPSTSPGRTRQPSPTVVDQVRAGCPTASRRSGARPRAPRRRRSRTSRRSSAGRTRRRRRRARPTSSRVTGAVHDDPVRPGPARAAGRAPGRRRPTSTSSRPTRCSVTRVGRQRGDRVEQLEHALVRQPVGDAQHGDPAALAAGRSAWVRRAAGRSPARRRRIRSAGEAVVATSSSASAGSLTSSSSQRR